MKTYDFQYHEMHQAGADHADPRRAAAYDAKMRKFRDYQAEAQRISDLLDICPRHAVLDMGAGTGALALELARRSKEVVAVDVSRPMLDILVSKAQAQGITNITTANAGFLTYDNAGRRFDRIISNVVLHHLPDFWKAVALRRIHGMLADDGLFYLADVVFSFDIDSYQGEMNAFLSRLEESTDEEFVRDGILHFREEFSTFEWLLDVILGKAGFAIVHKDVTGRGIISYVLRKA